MKEIPEFLSFEKLNSFTSLSSSVGLATRIFLFYLFGDLNEQRRKTHTGSVVRKKSDITTVFCYAAMSGALIGEIEAN